jgi:hypothetical protein
MQDRPAPGIDTAERPEKVDNPNWEVVAEYDLLGGPLCRFL